MAVQERMGLPRHVDWVSLYRARDAASGPLFAVVTANPAAGSFDADVLDAAGVRYLHVGGYRAIVFRGAVDVPVLAPAHAARAWCGSLSRLRIRFPAEPTG